MAPIENAPISVIDSVGEDRELFKSVRLTSPDIDLIYDVLAEAEFNDSPNGRAALERTTTILNMLENLPRGYQGQLKMFRITVLPTVEEPVTQERDQEYEYQDREDHEAGFLEAAHDALDKF